MAKNLITAGRVRTYFAMLALLMLSACSPRYDWREWRAGSPAWTALFPDKPQTQTRTVNLAGRSLNMTMTVARVDTLTFAVGHAVVPATAPQAAWRQVLRDALLRNIQGTSRSEQTVVIPRLAQGPIQGQSPIEALALEADGKIGDKPMHLSARVTSYAVGSSQAVIQIMVLGPQDVLTAPAGKQAVETFFTSLRLE